MLELALPAALVVSVLGWKAMDILAARAAARGDGVDALREEMGTMRREYRDRCDEGLEDLQNSRVRIEELEERMTRYELEKINSGTR